MKTTITPIYKYVLLVDDDLEPDEIMDLRDGIDRWLESDDKFFTMYRSYATIVPIQVANLVQIDE
jgi:hypothetical protein